MKKTIEWFEPSWSYVPELNKEFREVLRLKLWLRAWLVSALVACIGAYLAKKLIPDLDFSWTKALVTSWLAMLGIFAVMYAIFRFVPPVIRISQKGVSRQHGQAVRWRQRHDIRLITLDWTDPSAPRLQVETESKPLAIGIGPKIDRTLLVTFLRQTFPELLVQETL